MSAHLVDVFFYGSYINFKVLAEVNINERPHKVAWLNGYELVISPLANIIKEHSSVVFGIVTKLTHSELERLYTEHAQHKLGGIYLPEAILVSTDTDSIVPALTYISHDMKTEHAEPDYVDRILNPAKKYGFPGKYLQYIESFK
jgi:AIG2-like family